MKKLAHLFTISLLMLFVLLSLSACSSSDNPPTTCQHQWVEATCTFPKTCRLCQKTEGEATGHNFTDATCTEPSICTFCNMINKQATGHSIVVDNAIATTCTANGFTEGKHCSVCNEVIIKQTEIKATGHTWESATCTTPKTCKICNETEGKANGHTEVIDKAVAATCTTSGLTSGKHCSVCNEILAKQVGIDATGHVWKEATCKNPKTCSKCMTIEGSPIEHNYQNGKCTTCNQVDPKEKEFESASMAYFYLTIANQLCDDIMDSIYGAWYFAIYKADDYLNINSCLNAFCAQANLDFDDTVVALNDVLAYMGYSNPTGTQQLATLRTISTAIDVVIQTYINYETYNSIDVNLANAKEALKSVTNNYADYTGYPTLKMYYSEILSYADFCKSPSGSFEQLKTLINTFDSNLRYYKNDLSFIFD